jgi:hypothetical protein
MKTLDQIAAELSQSTYEKKADDIKQKISRMVAFIENATVEVKKVSVSKKGSGGWKNPSSLQHRGLWGYPQVFVTTEGKPVKTRHRFALTPFYVECSYQSKVFEMDESRPAVPELFTHEGPRSVFRGQYNTEDLGIWLAENCPSLHELDMRVRAEWDKQIEAFPKEADRYLDKLGGKQRVNFQTKLAKEFGKYKGDLMNMPPKLLYEIFQFTLDHDTAMSSLMSFCRKNRADAAFIDESDVEAALKLAQVSEVQEA